MGLFDKIQDVKARYDNDFVRAGDYVIRIDNVKVGENRKGIAVFIINMTVLHTLEAVTSPNGQASHRAGDSVVVIFSKAQDQFLGNVQNFVSRISNVDPAEVDKEDCEFITSDAQPLAGTLTRLTARDVPMKSKTGQTGPPGIFTTKRWHPPYTARQVNEILTESEKKAFFPDGKLEELIAAEEKPATK